MAHAGAQLVAGLAVQPGERVVVKTRFSAFFNTNLDSVLRWGVAPRPPMPSSAVAWQSIRFATTCRRMGVERVVLVGVQTPNCVRGTAWDAIALDYPQVTVLADATASATEEVQLANLSDMQRVHIDTPTVAQWVSELGPRI